MIEQIKARHKLAEQRIARDGYDNDEPCKHIRAIELYRRNQECTT